AGGRTVTALPLRRIGVEHLPLWSFHGPILWLAAGFSFDFARQPRGGAIACLGGVVHLGRLLELPARRRSAGEPCARSARPGRRNHSFGLSCRLLEPARLGRRLFLAGL